MEPHFSKLQVLVDLGLTQVQAKVYLALVESGPLRISSIAKISKVARPDVYRNLSNLQNIGLAEKIIGRPVEYQAIPIKKGLTLLLDTETQHYETVRSETQILLDTVTLEKLNNNKIEAETPHLVLIPSGKTVIEEIKTAIEKAEVSIDLVLSWKRFSQGIASVFAESIEIAWRKNVKIRFVIERPPESKTAEQLICFCRKKPFCQVRFIPHYPKAIFGIYDGKEIFIVLESKMDLPGSPALWSNNPSLIGLAKDYFEFLWPTSITKPQIPQA